ncbi:Hnr protein [Klebsiella oxytoca]|nr:Hnr protein [Klebsiella oxytoca]
MTQPLAGKQILIVEDEPVFRSLMGNDSNLLIVFYVQIMPDDFVMQLHRF